MEKLGFTPVMNEFFEERVKEFMASRDSGEFKTEGAENIKTFEDYTSWLKS